MQDFYIAITKVNSTLEGRPNRAKRHAYFNGETCLYRSFRRNIQSPLDGLYMIDVETALDGLRVSIEFSEVSSSQAAAVFGPKLVLSPYCDCTQQLLFPFGRV